MHHLLEIFLLLLLALVIGWLIGWFLRCVLFRRDERAPELPKVSAPEFKPRHKPVARAKPAHAPAAVAAEPAAGAETAGEAGGAAAAAGGATAAKDMPVYGLSSPVGEPDDLQMISGIGPKLEKMLHEQGIFHFAQIAAWKKKDIAEMDTRLKFKGRIEREEWVRQAKLLAAGKLDQFEREYGTGGKKGADGKTRSGTRTRKTGTGTAAKAASSASTGKRKGAGKTDGQDMPAFGLGAPVGGKPDDLQMISGIGPKLEKMLHDMGIYHFAQIAAWKKKDIEEIDSKLKFKGRIEREEWVRQAKLLAAGKLDQFEREYGTGGKKDASGKARSGTRTRKKK